MNDANRRTEDPEISDTAAENRQLIRRRRDLSREQVDKIVAWERERKLRLAELPTSTRIATQDDVRQFYYPSGVPNPVVQTWPDELVAARDPFSDRAEEFRVLRSQLLAGVLAGVERPALAVVSSEDGDGRTYLAANLAICLSQFAGRTLLIDGDLRRPRLHRLFSLGTPVGLSNLLAGSGQGEAVVRVEGVDGLHLMGAGTLMPDPVQLLQGPRLGVLVQEMLERFDYVLFDTPSNRAGPDARIITAQAGAALLVGRQGHSRVDLLKRLLAQLNLGHSLVAGVVMNRR
ncbi:hypothetical protein GCM10027034_13820 [Ramlibacter solisilvae]|uniref:CpsD/CapB family tyrosine-protein kinase n=1 Tax=Ramlibacter tataouinensis TaxID=94132 RepID=UPI0013147060|nr:CpsD/CapB family tyrosine-protein kinase [Ramlibacter tataouinensis]